MGSFMTGLEQLLQVPEVDIFHDLRELVKVYPDKIKLILYKQENRVRKAGYEDTLPVASNLKNHHNDSQISEDSLIRSLRRSKQLISDVVLCNDFDLFCTFTFKSDRQNIELCKSKMSNWLQSQRKQWGRFGYLIVPEFHKDGQSLHFHALLQGYNGKLEDSGKLINGRTAYNIKSYRNGFSTAVRIDNRDAVSNYVKKYITKDMPQFNGKKRFWLSTGLNRPLTLHNQDFINNPAYNWSEKYNNELFTLYESGAILKEPS